MWWVAGALAIVVAAIVVGMRVHAANAEFAERGTSNDEAWRTYQRARFGDNAGRVQIETGIRYYRQAIELDPKFARGLGRTGDGAHGADLVRRAAARRTR